MDQRYFRIRPAYADETLDILTALPQATAVTGVDLFYKIDGRARLAPLACYKQAKIMGMDLSSAIVVHALDVGEENELHVLDLCCAPGAKLAYISDLAKHPLSTVTGVDISQHRIATCKRVCRKLRLGNVRLFKADGTSFRIHRPATRAGTLTRCFDKDVVLEPSSNLVKPYLCPRLWALDPQYTHPDLLYDRVLVDAECTHDGSVVHVKKWMNNAKPPLALTDSTRIRGLPQLQLSLLINGWNMLKPEGILVYATCSLTIEQNEQVIAQFVEWLIHRGIFHELTWENVPIPDNVPALSAKTEGTVLMKDLPWNRVVRLDPDYSGVSGMFIVKMRKCKPWC